MTNRQILLVANVGCLISQSTIFYLFWSIMGAQSASVYNIGLAATIIFISSLGVGVWMFFREHFDAG